LITGCRSLNKAINAILLNMGEKKPMFLFGGGSRKGCKESPSKNYARETKETEDSSLRHIE
jgi:hypothetical protein